MTAIMKSKADDHLERMREAARIPLRPTYAVGEVARLIGMSRGTVIILCGLWEPEGMAGRDARGMESYRTPGGHRRVPVGALVDWLERNSSYEREFGTPGEEGD